MPEPSSRIRIATSETNGTTPRKWAWTPASSDFVDVIDRLVFEPFLGTVDTALDIGAGGGRFTEVLLPRLDA